MAPPGSRWWQPPDDADLDYGFDSDDLDDRFADPDRNSHHRTSTRESRDPRDPQDTGERGVFGNMSSWLQRQAGSHNSQLATTAVLSGAAVAGAIFGYQAYRRKEAVHDLKASIPALDEEHHAEKVRIAGTFAGRKQQVVELTRRIEAYRFWRRSQCDSAEQRG